MIYLTCHRKVVAGLKLKSPDFLNCALSRRPPLFTMNTLKSALYFKEVIIIGRSIIITVMLTAQNISGTLVSNFPYAENKISLITHSIQHGFIQYLSLA